jgi:hypothetical protein
MGQDKNSRPERVGTAVKLLYISLGIMVLQILFFSLLSKEVLKSIIFGMLIGVGPIWFFIYKTGKGRNWARICLLVWFIGGLLLSINSILQGLASNLFFIMLEIAITIIWAVALVFLFQKPSSDWFKAINKAKQYAATNYQRASQGNIKVNNWKIVSYFFLVFIITLILVTALDMMFKLSGFKIPHNYINIVRFLLPLIVGIWYVRRMIQSGKFDV